ARLGGDEFCLLLPETAEEGALEGLRKLRSGVLSLAREEEWPISVSLGAVTFFDVPSSVDDAIVQADHLMYRVKAGGKNAILQEVVGGGGSLPFSGSAPA
ncbi:MAG: diguanylate cyclase, partial [Longimicrobiales bacterium]|nr:diguanylate cyclase [Longimicrobiales bacterium]